MTFTTSITSAPSTTTPEVAAGVAQFLSPIVVNLTALAVDFKQLHWHVRGGNFVAVHELLDTIVDHAHDAADTLAERVVALGLPVDGRIGTVAAQTATRVLPEGFINSEQVITLAIEQVDAVLQSIKSAIDELGEIDPPSQDAAIEVARIFDKDRWFLFAHKSQG